MKLLADGLTALRFVVALPMIWLGLTQPPARSLAPAVWLTIVAWTSDWLDGPLARRSGFSQQTWMGRHDLEADLAVVIAQAVVLASWGIVLPALLTVLITVGWVTWCALHGQGALTLLAQGMWTDRKRLEVNTAPLQLATFVVYAGFILAAWNREAKLGYILAGWLAVTLLFSPGRSWHRFSSYFVVTKRFLMQKPPPLPASEQLAEDPHRVNSMES